MKNIVALFVGLVIAGQAFGATAISTRFAGQYELENVMERDYTIPTIRVSSVPASGANSTNTLAVYLVADVDDNMTTNVGDTVTTYFPVGTYTFVGTTNISMDLPVGADETLYITNAAGTAITNTIMLYRE